MKKLTVYIFYITVFLLLISFNFNDKIITGGWYQQWLPTGLGNAPVKDMLFSDSLTGYIIAGSPYLLKTTNGGDNWFVNQNFGDTVQLRNIKVINKDSLILSETNSIYKTTNKGVNWVRYFFPGYPYNEMVAFWMDAINFDSIWIACGTGFQQPQLYFSSDGGMNWTLKYQQSTGQGNFKKIYFYNKNIGFCSRYNQINKTSNGGINWFEVVAGQGYNDIYFSDSLTGWRSRPYKTTDGGLTWVDYYPKLPNIVLNIFYQMSKFSKDTIWGVGGTEYYNNGYRAVIYKSTNGGENWGYQKLDTSIHASRYEFCCFIDSKNGWAYAGTGLHTTTGGNDTTFYTSISNITQIPPKNFELKQNYPNPYNNSSLIEYYVNETGWVKLKIFDITGKEIGTLVNEEQNTGGYGVPVSIPLSSGVYFYKMVYVNRKGEMQMDTKKMVVIK